ncbi:MAG TPA: hypothetical protein VKD21_12600 [Acidimicrobiales bacterium]|nr:hypothetical protein [Acidimicrobiales bacterium]
MRVMDCADVAEVAPELALEILGGAERAAAIAHLEGCVSCQQLVDTLAADADRLLMLAPSAEPPAGFQDRVLTSLTQVAQPEAPPARSPAARTPTRRARARTRGVAMLALAASVALVALALGLGPAARPSPAGAEMRTGAGEVVGHVFVHGEPEAALFMTLPGWTDQVERYAPPDQTYDLRIERGDHAPRVVPLDLEHDSSWGATLDVDPDSITAVAVVDSQGHVWCEAEL